ncbi:MAG: glycoside hydrolase family 18 protein [Phycisphaerae bacterium]|nr:glycoside hydrolase family 18 protein [Phycisphaerae bacterium]
MPVLLLAGVGSAAYVCWSPGKDFTDGRHDRGHNAIWLQHGWLADDAWFSGDAGDALKLRLRDSEEIARLAQILRMHRITDVFPHLCPAGPNGQLPGLDPGQVQRFLDGTQGIRVIPWVGGVRGVHCLPDVPAWRHGFVASVRELLASFPGFAGVHLNIEPWPSGDADLLELLDELRAALPPGKILSVAAYPPPTVWHRFPDVHWEQEYFREVAGRVDQVSVMMYDTSLRWAKPYRRLIAQWTTEVLIWSAGTPVLLGLPAYDDTGVGYHHPAVENLEHALAGVHAGLCSLDALPSHYQGIALYSEWEMDDDEWRHLREHFLATDGLTVSR